MQSNRIAFSIGVLSNHSSIAVLKIKVAIIAMFEPGRGQSGELTRFREGLRLRPWPVPGTATGTSWRNAQGVATLVAGVGPVNTAVNLMTWALQSGADWRRTYWLISGIAGGNPRYCTLGGTVWADWVVDGDLAHDIHPTDCPRAWSTGILPLGAARPFAAPKHTGGLFGQPAQVYQLNLKLANWARTISQTADLLDTATLAKARAPYRKFVSTNAKPSVNRGAVLSAARFWHGPHHNAWAERWVRFWTRGRGKFYASSMEDSGTLGALRKLASLGLAKWERVLLLRGVSNYTLPPPLARRHRSGSGKSILAADCPGLEVALENNWRCARRVIEALLEHK